MLPRQCIQNEYFVLLFLRIQVQAFLFPPLSAVRPLQVVLGITPACKDLLPASQHSQAAADRPCPGLDSLADGDGGSVMDEPPREPLPPPMAE